MFDLLTSFKKKYNSMTQDSTLTWKHPNKCQSYNKLFRLKDKILSFLWGDKSCDCDLNVEIIMKCYMKCNSSNKFMMVYRDFMRNYSNDIKLISQMIIPRFNWRTKKKEQNVQCKSLLTGVWFKQAINNMYTIWQFFSDFFLQIWIFSPSSRKFLLHLSLLSPKKFI